MDHVHESGSWRRRRWRWAMPLSIRDERVAGGWPVAVAMASKAPTRNTASWTNYPHLRAAENPRAQHVYMRLTVRRAALAPLASLLVGG